MFRRKKKPAEDESKASSAEGTPQRESDWLGHKLA